ncbi:MAG TPA: DUF5683 domain-containing protein [Chitinophagaceae bacterium]|jgi:hypothetical protein
MRFIQVFILLISVCIVTNLSAQNNKQQLASASILDTTIKKDSTKKVAKDSTPVLKDSLRKKKHDPAKATRRSAIIPGWGQAYNHEYWKIPIVYGALAIPAATFVYNNKWYKKTRDAYTIVVTGDTSRYDEIDPKLISKATGQPLSAQDLQYYRNAFRKDRDYSVLFFLIAWGVNIVDATVFGHLKDFDVSDELSMHVTPDYNPATKTVSVGFAFNLKTQQRKPLPAF